ncbi:hypothetical protein LY11_02240 [Pedobacter cryoconitis]|uniref:Uncharacterized protein n=1 Tax=Pedobacter cryoconitis TaxID=188932 RepID=A0A327SQY8_9SPHI|nr:hypothetical protein LY11_02240 [Pedobacter cryoconitis]
MNIYLIHQFIEQIYTLPIDVHNKMPLDSTTRVDHKYLFQKKYKFLEALYENIVKPPV